MEEEDQHFFEKPDFRIDTNIWGEFTDEDWVNCMMNEEMLISGITKRRKIYSICKERYLILYRKREQLMRNADLKKPLCLVLAEALFWLSDWKGSEFFLRELDGCLNGSDERLKQLHETVKRIREFVEEEEEELEKLDVRDEMPVVHVSPQFPCVRLSPQELDLSSVVDRWEACKNEVGGDLVKEIFARYACVTTNELEDVFEVEGSTWHRLVRNGFLENSIEGVSENSKIKHPSRIIRILKKTSECVEAVGPVLALFDSYDETFICQLHARLMDGENFESEFDEDGLEICIMVIPAGDYRRQGCYTYHGDTHVQYCAFKEIPEFMQRYCAGARAVLYDPEMDVFMKVAWLQWAFLCVHPFGDGNGRVARIISSLPLLKLGLPPVVVRKERKQEYFDCLDVADREYGLMPLRNFLLSSYLEGIETTRAVGMTPEADLKKPSRFRSGARSGLSKASTSSHGGSPDVSPPESPK